MRLKSDDIIALEDYLLYDKKHSSAAHNRANFRSRFQFMQKWFAMQKLEFNRVNFTKFIRYLKEAEYSNATINNFIKVAKHVDKLFKVEEIQDYSYYPKDTTPPDVLTAEQIAEMMYKHMPYDRDAEIKNQRYKAIIHTMYLTGGRINEILSLTWTDVKQIMMPDGSYAYVLVLNQTKINELRYAPITEELFNELNALHHWGHHVFSNQKGEQVRRQTVSTDLKRRAEACGINKRVYNHMMRHSFIRFMLRNGAPLTTVSHMVGHKSIETTYKHYTEGLIAEYLETLYGYHPHLKKQQTLKLVEKRVIDMVHSFLDLSRFSVRHKAVKNRIELEIKEHD